jgi:UDP-2-acetamido-2,6-beta-L-arabino-hexul-4-ose reductase
MSMKVKIIKVELKSDERGWFAELLKKSQVEKTEFGQAALATSKPGAIRGNHCHSRKTEWFCVIRGKAKLVLEDAKTNERKEFILDDNDLQVIEIDPYVYHAIQNIGNDIMYLFHYVDEPFDPNDPDTIPKKVI